VKKLLTVLAGELSVRIVMTSHRENKDFYYFVKSANVKHFLFSTVLVTGTRSPPTMQIINGRSGLFCCCYLCVRVFVKKLKSSQKFFCRRHFSFCRGSPSPGIIIIIIIREFRTLSPINLKRDLGIPPPPLFCVINDTPGGC
jgi:hypothetical protein